jgi:hypothetical protein
MGTASIGVINYIDCIGGAVGIKGAIVLSIIIMLGSVCALHIPVVIIYYTRGMKGVVKFREGWESLWSTPAEDEYSTDDDDHTGNTPLW